VVSKRRVSARIQCQHDEIETERARRKEAKKERGKERNEAGMRAHRVSARISDAYTDVNFGPGRSRFRRHAKNSFSFFLSTIVSLHPARPNSATSPESGTNQGASVYSASRIWRTWISSTDELRGINENLYL